MTGGHKFVRQEPIGPFIVDFVCRSRRLIVEVDGGQHAENSDDKIRDRWLSERGYRVLRFWNNDVLQNIEGALEIVSAALVDASPTRIADAIRPLPACGERLIIAILIVFFLLPTAAHACQGRGWQFETVTLLNRLPDTAQEEPIVAQVEVVEPLPPFPAAKGFWFTHLIRVRVIEPVKGSAKGDELVVNTRGTLCDQNATEKMTGQRNYIAGHMEKQPDGAMHFTGRWRRDLASGGLVKDAD